MLKWPTTQQLFSQEVYLELQWYTPSSFAVAFVTVKRDWRSSVVIFLRWLNTIISLPLNHVIYGLISPPITVQLISIALPTFSTVLDAFKLMPCIPGK